MDAPSTRRPLFGWIASMGYQYWQDWMRFDMSGMAFGLDLACIPGIATAGLVPMAAMIFMIRKTTAFNRGVAVFWGTLASAAIANAGLRLFHPVDAALMVIVWQFGTVIAFTLLATLARDAPVPLRPIVPALRQGS